VVVFRTPLAAAYGVGVASDEGAGAGDEDRSPDNICWSRRHVWRTVVVAETILGSSRGGEWYGRAAASDGARKSHGSALGKSMIVFVI